MASPTQPEKLIEASMNNNFFSFFSRLAHILQELTAEEL